MTPPVISVPRADFSDAARSIAVSFEGASSAGTQRETGKSVSVAVNDTKNPESPFSSREFTVQLSRDVVTRKTIKTREVRGRNWDEYTSAMTSAYQQLQEECGEGLVRTVDRAVPTRKAGSGILSSLLRAECLEYQRMKPVIDSADAASLTITELGLMVTLAKREERRALGLLESLDVTVEAFRRLFVLNQMPPHALNTDGSLSIQWKDLVISPHRPSGLPTTERRKIFQTTPSGKVAETVYTVSCSRVVVNEKNSRKAVCGAVDINYTTSQGNLKNHFNYHVEGSSGKLASTFQYLNQLLAGRTGIGLDAVSPEP